MFFFIMLLELIKNFFVEAPSSGVICLVRLQIFNERKKFVLTKHSQRIIFLMRGIYKLNEEYIESLRRIVDT